jgi:hypothetical protein
MSGYLLGRLVRADSSLLLKVKDHADFGFLETLHRIADFLLSVSIK